MIGQKVITLKSPIEDTLYTIFTCYVDDYPNKVNAVLGILLNCLFTSQVPDQVTPVDFKLIIQYIVKHAAADYCC